MKTRTGLAAVTTAGLAVGMLAFAGVGTASADPVSLELNYHCVFPQIDSQPLKIRIKSDIPSSIKVGQNTGAFKIDTVNTVYDDTTAGLNLVGAKTLEGTAKATATVHAPQGNITVKPPITVDKVNVPESGPFDLHAAGSTPNLKFSKAGDAYIDVTALDLTMTARDETGAALDLDGDGNENFFAPCTQDPGQKNTLAKFTITN
ncbi:hypothetical protein RKE29_21260 [Streptomyces sp. B1866]|uniref:DUF6801 domain-containing protein n=1 Tax=Streptomyces sp. B1866 TaxID=3075431 RepID=UPI00289116D5|nr:DUF6801 domain-containing protein [Streptomyces sp. B1866]MDT3399143.1 hypothetical protein [Streptomyces sp. B1866]